MEPYQQRVVDEKAELDERLTKLSRFMTTPDLLGKVPREEQGRLNIQINLMRALSHCLGERIAAFSKE